MVKVLADKKALPNNGKLLIEWASRKHVELVDPSSAKTAADYITAAKDVTAIAATGGLASIGGWSDDLVSNLPSNVKAVCNMGAGYDGLGDLSRFKAKQIQVSNTPTGVSQSTADCGLYLILGCLRNFGELATSLRQGNWFGDIPLANEYDGKTLGILGLGGIGALVRDKVVGSLGFEKIIYHNRRRADPETEKDTTYVSFDELLKQSDIIVTILPLTSSTRHIINRESLAKTKRGVIIVNIGRGPLIDEEALVESLESGQVGSVGLDVYENEPKIHPKLLSSKNTLLLPHAGTHTSVARAKMLNELIANLESVIDTGKVISLVPELR